MRPHPFQITGWQVCFYVALPVFFFLSLLVWSVWSPKTYGVFAGGEVGVLESAHIIAALVGLVFGIKLTVVYIRKSNFWGIFLSVIASLICFYIAGEEASYGQHFFEWEGHDFFQRLNDQNETNLHNMSSWFGQKPRVLLELAIVLGGIALPLFPSFMLKVVPVGLREYAPTILFLPVSLLVVLSRLPERLDLQGSYFFADGVRYSEIQELFMFMFIALYLYFVLRLEKHRSLTP